MGVLYMKANRKEQSNRDTAEKQELVIVEMLEFLIEHGDYHDVNAVAIALEERMRSIGLYTKFVNEMSGQNLHDRNMDLRRANIGGVDESE